MNAEIARLEKEAGKLRHIIDNNREYTNFLFDDLTDTDIHNQKQDLIRSSLIPFQSNPDSLAGILSSITGSFLGTLAGDAIMLRSFGGERIGDSDGMKNLQKKWD